MTNLDPRAKIGDVVIVRKVYLKTSTGSYSNESIVTQQFKVDKAKVEDGWIYFDKTSRKKVIQSDILKNLTTGETYA